MAKYYFEDVRIGFKNFSGKEGPYTRKGDRSFVVFLDPSTAEDLENKGLNIKWPKPLEHPVEDDRRQPYLQVKVKIDGPYPPEIVVIADGDINLSLPQKNLELLLECDYFVVEEIRTARRFLRKAGYNKK